MLHNKINYLLLFIVGDWSSWFIHFCTPFFKIFFVLLGRWRFFKVSCACIKERGIFINKFEPLFFRAEIKTIHNILFGLRQHQLNSFFKELIRIRCKDHKLIPSRTFVGDLGSSKGVDNINLILPTKILEDINFRWRAKRLIDGEDVHRFDKLHIHDHVDVVIFILFINFDKRETKFKWVDDYLGIADWLFLFFIVFQHQIAVIFDLSYHFVSEGVVFWEIVDVFFQRYVFPYLVDIFSTFVIFKHF